MGRTEGYSDFVSVHELLHTLQYAHRGRRLYMKSSTDGESCTIWLEHIAFVTYAGYAARQPLRFQNLRLTGPWYGWHITENTSQFPDWWGVPFPDHVGEDALQQIWSTANFVQSAYRLYLASWNSDGTYPNEMLNLAECGCDPASFLETLSAEGKDYYSHNAWAIVGDIHYKIRNLIT